MMLLLYEERGDATARRPSVRLSVTFMYDFHNRFEYFDNNFTAD